MYDLQEYYIQLTGWTEQRSAEANMRLFWNRLRQERDFSVTRTIDRITSSARRRAAQIVAEDVTSDPTYRYTPSQVENFVYYRIEEYEEIDTEMKVSKWLAKELKSRLNYKMPGHIKSQVGQILTETEPQTLRIRFSLGCYGTAEEYYYRGSCYWGGYAASRDYIEDSGGGAVRLYDNNDRIVGRAWFLPHSDPDIDNGFIMFNFYGQDEYAHYYVWGDLISEALRVQQQKTSIDLYAPCDREIYLNSDTSVFIGTVHTPGPSALYLEYQLSVPYTWHYEQNTAYCDWCEEYVSSVEYIDSVDRYVCENCRDRNFTWVDAGNHRGYYPDENIVVVDGTVYYEEDECLIWCEGEYHLKEDVVEDEKYNYHLREDEGVTWAQCEDGSIWPIDCLAYNKKTGEYELI